MTDWICRGVLSRNWSHSESKHAINYLEMAAILLGFQTFARDISNTYIRIMCNNTTAVNVFNHMETSLSHPDLCNSVAKGLWMVYGLYNMAHIFRKQNLTAYFESRRNQRKSEWKLHKAWLLMPLKDWISSHLLTYLFTYKSPISKMGVL